MRRIVFRQLHIQYPHAQKSSVPLSSMIVIIAFLQELYHRNNQPMLLTGALLIVSTNTIFHKKSYVV